MTTYALASLVRVRANCAYSADDHSPREVNVRDVEAYDEDYDRGSWVDLYRHPKAASPGWVTEAFDALRAAFRNGYYGGPLAALVNRNVGPSPYAAGVGMEE